MAVPNIPRWSDLDPAQRATAVIEWCWEHGIDTSSILPSHLIAAMTAWNDSMYQERVDMGEDYPFDASPMDYVHQIRAIAAFLRSRI